MRKCTYGAMVYVLGLITITLPKKIENMNTSINKCVNMFVLLTTSAVFISCLQSDIICKTEYAITEMSDMDYEHFRDRLFEMGNDDLPILNNTEGDFFNLFFSNRRNGFDLSHKCVLFLTGSGGTVMSNKKTIFSVIKECFNMNEKPLSASWQLLILPQNIVNKTNFNAVITYGMKKKITSKHVMKVLHH